MNEIPNRPKGRNFKNNKLKIVISPYTKTCSALLKKSAKKKIIFIDNLRQKLKYNEKAPL